MPLQTFYTRVVGGYIGVWGFLLAPETMTYDADKNMHAYYVQDPCTVQRRMTLNNVICDS